MLFPIRLGLPTREKRLSGPCRALGPVGFLMAQRVKTPPAMPETWETGSIPGSGRSPEGGNGNPLHYACLKNPVDRGASGLQSMGWQRVRHNRATEHTVSTRRGGSGELGDSRPASVSGRNTWMSELGGCVGERTWAPEAREAEVQGSGTPEAGQERDGGPQSRLGGGVAHGPRDSAQPSRALASGCRSASCGPVRSRCRWGRPGRQHVCRGLCYHCILQAITERTFPSTGPCEKELTWVLNSGNP